MKSIREFETIYKSDIINLLQDMIKINTVNPPGNEMELALYLRKKFKEFGLNSTIDKIDKGRSNITCRIKGKGYKKALLLNGHLDTVPIGEAKWDLDPFSGEEVDGYIYGRGSSDMKGGLAAMVIAMQAITEEKIDLEGDLIFAGTAGEETDSIGAFFYLEKYGLDEVEAIAISEPTSCRIATAEKGALWVNITTYGRTAHGAFPQEGINAITHMHEVVERLMKYEFNYTPHSLLGHPTMNISTIVGGSKTNVVPDICNLTIDIRTVPPMNHESIIKELERLIYSIKDEIPEFEATIKVVNNRPAVETKGDNPFIQLGQDIIEEYLGKSLPLRTVDFYTDAAVFLPGTNLPCIIYGPGATEIAHQPNERVSIEDLVEAFYFYYVLIKKQLTR